MRLTGAMDVWVANVSGAWLLKRGLAGGDYRRLGVKLAIVQDYELVRNFHLTKHHYPSPSTVSFTNVQRCMITAYAQWIPPHFATAIASSSWESNPLPITALCMSTLHCCMRLFATIDPHGV